MVGVKKLKRPGRPPLVPRPKAVRKRGKSKGATRISRDREDNLDSDSVLVASFELEVCPVQVKSVEDPLCDVCTTLNNVKSGHCENLTIENVTVLEGQSSGELSPAKCPNFKTLLECPASLDSAEKDVVEWKGLDAIYNKTVNSQPTGKTYSRT